MHFWLPNTITTSTQKPMTTVVDYLLTQTTVEQMSAALEGLLTPYEQQELINRLQIFELLSQGVSQRQVAQKLGVGIATVTRGSRALQAGSYKIDTSK
ncbi:Trp family transcriptional regulator [Candidatus Njordibacter sp. Uisw_056]|jgi:TrpR family trp operon transcriptional repressor|uniref:Trp family transcriptional regulator n=1 Tax=Candidatus Njordibacter sp. Uisw_056 TaxID=3230973 RepID=UPI003D4A45DD